jgi:hypothetical protein
MNSCILTACYLKGCIYEHIMSSRLKFIDLFAIRFYPCLFLILLSLNRALCAFQATEEMKDFGNRIEGTTGRLHAREDLELIAIHRNFEQFARGANLQVRFYLPKPTVQTQKTSIARKVSIEALEIQDTIHYFMQSKQLNWEEGKWNSFSPWPTKDVIDPLGLDWSNIGVRATFRDGNEPPVYMPVDVVQSSHLVKSSYTFYFRTSLDLHSLEKLLIGPSGQITRLETEECKFSPTCVLYPATSSQAFDVDMTRLPAGVYTVRMIGHVPRTSVKPTLSVRMYHPGN